MKQNNISFHKKRVTIALSCYKADSYINGYINCLKLQENIDELQLVVFDYPYSHTNPQQVKQAIHQLDQDTVSYVDRGTTKEDLYTAWNQIFSSASTDYIANLNVDDRVSKDYFHLAVKTLDSLDLDVFSTNAIALSIAGDLSTEIERMRHFEEHEYNQSMVRLYGLNEFVRVHGGYFKKRNPPHCAPVWKLSWHKRIGDFNPIEFDWCSDYEYWLRMAAAGANFGVHNSFKTYYFLSATGTASDRLYFKENQSIIEKWKISFPLVGYKETSFSQTQDMMHHCFNLHTYFSSREFFYNQKDLVSIVVLYHKIDDYLVECIKSIQSQDYPLFDCILVFDNDPESKLQKYSRAIVGDDLRFRFASLGQKCERNYARNVGIELAIGDYITIVDGDDLLPRDSLSKRLNYASKLAAGAKKVVFGGFRCFGVDTGDSTLVRGISSYTVETLRVQIIHHGGVLFPTKLLKKSRYCTDKSDLLLPSFKMGGEDVEFLICFLKENPGYEYVNCNSISYDYRQFVGGSHDKRCWPVFGLLSVLIKHYGFPNEGDREYKLSFARRVLEFRLWAEYLQNLGEERPHLPFSENQEKNLLGCLNRSQKESVFEKFTNVLEVKTDNSEAPISILDRLNKALIRDELQPTIASFESHLLKPQISQPMSQQLCLVGPYKREQKAHIDETDVVAELTSKRTSGSVMIDVGAHFGASLSPFLGRNWNVFAFEPDNSNRDKLLKLLNNHKNKGLVTLDTRCVSNRSQKNVSFYCSEQSTGISGLSAFHESHVEAQQVDTITLTDFFENKPLPQVDFLKIDTEGYDLFVLQGFPWDRVKPTVIECEFEDTKTVPLGYTFHDLAQFMVKKGYKVYVSEWHPIVRYGIRHDWNRLMPYPCELAEPKAWGNILAFYDNFTEKELITATSKVLKLGFNKKEKPKSTLIAQVLNTQDYISSTPSVRFVKVYASPYFTTLSEKVWRYAHPGKNVAQNLWFAVFDVPDSTLDRTYVSNICLMSNQAMTARITLGRKGDTEWEGSNENIRLLPNIAQSVQVHHRFVKQHWEIKVQVEVLEVNDHKTADLTFDNIYVNESLESMSQRITETEINLPLGNRLFREGDYEAAMTIYLLLHQKHPLPFDIYPKNAIMAAKKLGIDSVHTIDELIQSLELKFGKSGSGSDLSNALPQTREVTRTSLTREKTRKETKTRSPKITIILSCFRGDELIANYIDSLLDKQITDYCSLLAVNFPFSHKTPQFVEEQLKRYPDLKLINFDKNISLYEAWNLGCRVAETKYVGNLNLDDRVSPDYYSYGYSVLEENNGDLFSSFAVLTSSIGEVLENSYYDKPILEHYFGDADIVNYSIIDLVKIENQRLLKKGIPHCAPIWKKELHKELGYFDSRKFDFAADTEFWLRISSANKRMIVSKSHKIFFYQATGTASDRLMHPENEAILSKWSKTFPPPGYKETHLGRKHDLLQHCMNMNVIFSCAKYYNHLKGDRSFLNILKKSESVLKDKSAESNLLQTLQVEIKALDQSFYEELKRFHNLHIGQDALLICNGPSLNQVDFSRIEKDRFVIFGLNKIFLGIERLGIYPDYIAAVNPKVVSQSARELAVLPIPKFISNRSFCSILNEENNTFYIKTAPLPSKAGRFSKDIVQYVHEGWTVTHVALQIIYFMGIERVYIVGMDHRFKQHIAGKENSESKITGEDIDHFDPAYFGNGQSWDLPDLANSEISYRAALGVFQKEGREIYDCTIDGACNIFPKLNIDKLYTKRTLNIPKVSVIMPMFNTEQHLSTAIKSIIEQSFKDWELIIIDDGSTDNSVHIAHQFMERDPRIKFFQNAFGKGVSGTRNTGLKYARGEYITFLDSDDFFYQDSLASRVNILDNDKKVNACFCALEFVNDLGESLGLVLSQSERVYYKDFWKFPLQMTTPLIRARVIGELRFDQSLTNGEDFLFLSELAKKINVFRGTQKPGVGYRVPPKSTVTNNYYLQEENFQKVFAQVYANYHSFNNENSKYKGEWPSMNSILCEQKINCLLWACLTCDKQKFISLMQDRELAALVNSKAIASLVKNKLPFLTLRYFGCSIKSFKELLRKPPIVQFIGDIEIYQLAPNLCYEIQNIQDSDQKSRDKMNLLKPYSLKIMAGVLFHKLDDNQWQYINSGNVVDNSDRLWQAVFSLSSNMTSDCTFVGGINLMSSKRTKVRVTLGRQGSTEWEGLSQDIQLLPNSVQSVQLSHKFTKQHTALKVQAEILEIEASDMVDITIDNVYVSESLIPLIRVFRDN